MLTFKVWMICRTKFSIPYNFQLKFPPICFLHKTVRKVWFWKPVQVEQNVIIPWMIQFKILYLILHLRHLLMWNLIQNVLGGKPWNDPFGSPPPHLGQWISQKPHDRPNQNMINQMILFIYDYGNFQHHNHQFDAPHWVAHCTSRDSCR